MRPFRFLREFAWLYVHRRCHPNQFFTLRELFAFAWVLSRKGER